MKTFSIIAAINNDALIGIKEEGKYYLPWPTVREDMNFFKAKTCETPSDFMNAIIMGYNTWLSMPQVYKNNTKRYNIIICRDHQTFTNGTNFYYIDNFDQALTHIETLTNIHNIYVIGGSHIYDCALNHKQLDNIYITHINQSYPKNNAVERLIYFPIDHQAFKYLIDYSMLTKVDESDIKCEQGFNLQYRFLHYKVTSTNFFNLIKDLKIPTIQTGNLIMSNTNLDEYQYYHLIEHIIHNGKLKSSRNATTLSVFGYQLRYDLSKGFPLSTLKRVFWRGVVEELLWMLKGSTNVKDLQQKGIKIWDKNSSQEYLQKYGLPYQEGDIGPGYGFQMRYAGADYIDCHTNYQGKGIDQLTNCINLINNDPSSRRIIIDLWNVKDIDKMALPPCHMLYQFSVDQDVLNCHLYQRSWDVFLGWNTSTAALLTHLLAHHCGLKPGILLHTITDVHIYKPHLDNGCIDELLKRTPRDPPKLSIKNTHTNITDYTFDDFVLENYYPYPSIQAEMIA